MTPAAFRIFRLVIALVLVTGMGVMLWPELARLPTRMTLQWPLLAAAGALVAVTLALMSLSLQFSVRATSRRHELIRGVAWRITVIRSYASLLLPLGGVASALLMLQRWAQCNWSTAAACVGLLAVTQVATLFALSGAVLLLTFNYVRTAETAVAGTALLACSVVVWTSWRLRHRLVSFLKWAGGAGRHIKSIPRMDVGDARALALLIATQIALFLARGIRLYWIGIGLGFELHVLEALLMAAVAELAIVINLTPGGLGVREAVVLAFGTQIGLAPSASFAIAAVDRAALTIIVALASVATILLSGSNKTEGQNQSPRE